jgi:hypothetical protein
MKDLSVNVLEKDLVMGTFTHRNTKFPLLLESVKKYYPDLLFILQYDDKLISPNMEALRQKFISTGKRYWLFLDDDIQFMNSSLIPKALETLISNDFAGVCCHECINERWDNKPYDVSRLSVSEMNWMIGYFMLVDSKKVGHISCDRQTPDRSSMDMHYSLDIKLEGYKLGLTPDYLYHYAKPQFRNRLELEVLMKSLNDYFVTHYPENFFHTFANQYHTRLFDYDLLNQANDIYGFVSIDELKWLGENAAWKYSILEVGTLLGKSTKVLANTPGKVYTLDTLEPKNDECAFSSDEQRSKIEENLKDEIDIGKIKPLYGDRESFTSYFKDNDITFDMLWIDGNHSFEEVILDLETYMPFVQEEYSLICGHDVDYLPTNKAITQYFGEYNVVRGTDIWYIQK